MDRGSKRVAFVLGMALAFPSAASAKRPMTPRDVIELERLSDPQISPEGDQVVFVVTGLDAKENVYQSDLWRVGVNGGEPVRLTHHPKNDRAPAWSPDGRRIAFLSEREEEAQVFVMDARAGEAWKLTDAKESVSAFAWAPDGGAIAYLATDSPAEEEEKKTKAKDDEKVVDQDLKMTHLWKIDLASRQAVRLTEGGFTLSDPRWSPDGKQIAVVRRPTPKADDGGLADILLVPASGGEARLLYPNEGPDTSPRWSPDGKLIAFVSQDGNLPRPGNDALYVIPAEGGKPRALTHSDLDPGDPSWSPDGQRLWFVAGKGLRGIIWSVATAGGKAEPVVEGDFVTGALSLAQSNGAFAYIRQDPQSPPDVWVRKPGEEAVQRTRFNPQVADFMLGRAEPVRWKSADGREMEGILYLPPEREPGKPLLVEAHGGPSGVYTLSFPGSWGSYAHCYAGRGWGVFQPNFRGSSNYGDAFLRLNVKDWGRGDYQDIMSGVDYLIARGAADPARMAFHGWSYGGYLTAWTITQTDRFRAAACGAGLSNMFSMYSTNDLQRVLEDYFGGQPWDGPEAYHRASALYHIKKARTPTLILHGEEDKRVPLGQAQELYIGLKKNGLPVEMVTYPREPHGLREPNHQLDKMEREMAWFSRYVLGEGATDGRR